MAKLANRSRTPRAVVVSVEGFEAGEIVARELRAGGAGKRLGLGDQVAKTLGVGSVRSALLGGQVGKIEIVHLRNLWKGRRRSRASARDNVGVFPSTDRTPATRAPSYTGSTVRDASRRATSILGRAVTAATISDRDEPDRTRREHRHG